MNPKMHMKILTTAIFVIIGSGFFLLLYSCGKSGGDSLGKAWSIFALSFVFWFGFLFLAPLRCIENGCYGRVGRKWIKEPDCQYRLQYKCTDCGRIIDTNITVGLGEPW